VPPRYRRRPARQPEMEVQELAHSLSRHAGSLANLRQGESLDEPQAQHLAVAPVWYSPVPAGYRGQREPVLVEPANDLVELDRSEVAAVEQIGRRVGREVLDLADPGGFQAGESGRAEAQLGDIHCRTGSDGAVDELDEAHRRSRGEDVVV
jgi:hypothetical protein